MGRTGTLRVILACIFALALVTPARAEDNGLELLAKSQKLQGKLLRLQEKKPRDWSEAIGFLIVMREEAELLSFLAEENYAANPMQEGDSYDSHGPWMVSIALSRQKALFNALEEWTRFAATYGIRPAESRRDQAVRLKDLYYDELQQARSAYGRY